MLKIGGPSLYYEVMEFYEITEANRVGEYIAKVLAGKKPYYWYSSDYRARLFSELFLVILPFLFFQYWLSQKRTDVWYPMEKKLHITHSYLYGLIKKTHIIPQNDITGLTFIPFRQSTLYRLAFRPVERGHYCLEFKNAPKKLQLCFLPKSPEFEDEIRTLLGLPFP